VIVVDTSALLAIVLKEPLAGACRDVLEADDDVALSAGTLAEALVVASMRGVSDLLTTLVERLHLEVLPVTEERARRVSDAYATWGKGVHPAGLNFGDCFAYAAAKELACPLLYVGNDFLKTDLVPALSGT
jgi:ribonuclease VapC